MYYIITLSLWVLSFLFYYRIDYQLLDGTFEWLSAFFASTVFLYCYLVLKIYAIEWRELAKVQRSVNLFEILILPLLSFLYPLLMGFAISGTFAYPQTLSDFIVFLLAFLVLMDIKNYVRNFIKEEGCAFYPGVHDENRFRYVLSDPSPPKKREDLWPSDFLLIAIIIVTVLIGWFK